MATIVLVGCGSQKSFGSAPARELYTGDLFRKARAFAEARSDAWYVLSALHGLVAPQTVIAWYDVSMASLSRVEREVWGLGVRRALRRVVGPEDRLLFLAGGDYEEAVSGFANVEKPLAGLGIGQRKQWLKRALERAA